MATLAALAALFFLLVLPLYSIYCVYKPPRFLIGYLRAVYPDVLFEVTTTDKVMALSIDDAPSPHTDDIMSTAASRRWRKLVREGHELGNHAMHDESSRALSNDELERQVKQVKEKLVAAYDANHKILPNNYFRPGSGFFSWRMRDMLGNRGFRIVLGSIYPHDPQIPYPSTNAKHILSMAHPAPSSCATTGGPGRCPC
ncbi:hypothetical protein ACCO45_000986 [Purpureocillium lilacinum]|uniref:Uncharacterized protein n=1 Tax=Purpureocillium lilacinum TaxID=33203 RepID=A0ACC4E5S2_PURLI